MTPLTQGEVRTAEVCVSLTQKDWAMPTVATQQWSDNQLLLFLPPVAFKGEVRSPDAGLDRFTPVSNHYFWPAEIPLEGQGTGGHVRLLRHSFSQNRLRRLLEDDAAWRPEELERGLDLQHAGIAPLMLRMLQEVLSPGMGSETLVDALSTAVIVELVRHLRGGPREAGDRGRLARRQLITIRERVEAEDRPPPSVAELARLCGIGERHLLRLFRAATGETVSGFVRKAQTERARRMLSQTDLPMKQIAYRLGFSDASSFTASFRKTTCDTPASYRERTRARVYA